MIDSETLLLSRSDVARLLDIGECMDAVEKAFALYAEKKTQPPKVLGIHSVDGGFHIKAGIMGLNRNYFVAKVNGNFPNNFKTNGLPTIQGAMVVCDADNGRLLTIMDSMEITIIRTGAATGVAAKYLSRSDSTSLTICGCGNQGKISFQAISKIRKLKTVFAYDIDFKRAENFASEIANGSNINVVPVTGLMSALTESDMVVTCTTSRKPIIGKGDVGPGTFIAAVGADNEEKNEIDPTLIASSKLVTDLTEQSATIGDLHHAIKAGLMDRSHVHAEIGEVIIKERTGRISEDEVIIFDSTGTALQDVAAAAIVYEKAIQGDYLKFDFGKPGI